MTSKHFHGGETRKPHEHTPNSEIGIARFYHPPFGHGVGPVAMEHAKIEVLLYSEMPHAREKRLPQRPIIGPSGKDFVASGASKKF